MQSTGTASSKYEYLVVGRKGKIGGKYEIRGQDQIVELPGTFVPTLDRIVDTTSGVRVELYKIQPIRLNQPTVGVPCCLVHSRVCQPFSKACGKALQTRSTGKIPTVKSLDATQTPESQKFGGTKFTAQDLGYPIGRRSGCVFVVFTLNRSFYSTTSVHQCMC